MSNLKLKTVKRNVFGKKTVALRRQGITPVHVFGNGIESLALQCESSELNRVILQGGTTRLIEVGIDNEKLPRSVFIREIQRNAISGQILHVDFYQVNKLEKMTAEIPIVFIGDSPASKSKVNMVEHQLTHIEIEALPDNMPQHIQVDISNLKEAGDIIHVKDIKFADGVSSTTDPDQIIIKVSKIKAAAVTPAEEKPAAETTPVAADNTKEE
jgi:large subunit ribosomal protein L25